MIVVSTWMKSKTIFLHVNFLIVSSIMSHGSGSRDSKNADLLRIPIWIQNPDSGAGNRLNKPSSAHIKNIITLLQRAKSNERHLNCKIGLNSM